MRIGIDARLWNQTGVGRYVRNLVKYLLELDQKNDYVLFVRSEDFEDIKDQISKIKNKFKIQNSKFKIVKSDIRWHSVEEQIKFPLILNKYNLDLVHFPYFSVPVLYQRPYVVTIHDLIIDHFPTGEASSLISPLYYLKRAGYKIVLKKAVGNAKKVIVPSDATKQEIIDHLHTDPNKIIVTHEGIDEEIQNSKLRIQNDKKTKNIKTPYFLYVGNAYPHKNLDKLIEAFSLFIKEQKDKHIKLVFVGKEDYFYKRLKGKIKGLEIKKNIDFLGWVSDEDLSFLYENAKFVIIPSLMEGFGLTALEAMAKGKPVLASNIFSIKEVCEDAATYFDPKDPLDIKEKMSIIYKLDAKLIQAKQMLGLERTKYFSWKKMAQQTLLTYESCVGLRQG